VTRRDPLAHLDLPGVLRCLARDGHLDVARPDVRRLAARFAEPDADHFCTVGERIDQIGWPVTRDLAVALAAFAHIPIDHSLADDLVSAARRVVAGDPIDRPALAQRRIRLDLLALLGHGHAVPAVLLLAAQLHATPDPGLPEFLHAHAAWAAAHPTHAAALAHLAGATMGAIDGWLAYEAHRRLPSSAAESSAHVVAAALAITGPGILDELLAWSNVSLRTGQ
jgi:hypothetical protein